MPARSLRWVRDVLSRSIQLEHGRRQEAAPAASAKGRAPVAVDPATALLIEQRAELGARLLVHDPTTQLVRNLFLVHDELAEGGWAAVEALPPARLGLALTEAELLGQQEPSPMLTTIIETLRSIKAAGDARAAEAREEVRRQEWEREQPATPEVSETNYDEYELMERSWVGTVPGGLDLSDRALPSR